MELKLVFLGTGAGIPTLKRALPSIAVKRGGEVFLLDCGEGTQLQLLKASLGIGRLTKVFITHLHGDHYLGLPGLIQSMSLLGRKKPFLVYGPEGIVEFIYSILRTGYFSLGFEIRVEEYRPWKPIDFGDYTVTPFPVRHGIPCYGLCIEEKPRRGKFNAKKADELGIPKHLRGKLARGEPVKLPNGRIVYPHEIVGPPRRGRKIVYTSDTAPFDELVKVAKGADVLIHDSTFRSDVQDKACLYAHSTARQAAEIAAKAKVKLLVLTHISSRYSSKKDEETLLDEAKAIFPRAVIARDLLVIDIPLSK